VNNSPRRETAGGFSFGAFQMSADPNSTIGETLFGENSNAPVFVFAIISGQLMGRGYLKFHASAQKN
jgi:hypothetical protein